MKSKFVKVVLIIILLFSMSFCSVRYIDIIKADSGFDSSYDSGSSWDSGSDWGSSSWDNDYDYDNDYDNDSSSSNGTGYSGDLSVGSMLLILIFCIFPFIFTLFFTYVLKLLIRSNNNQSEQIIQRYPLLNQLEANKIIPNFNIQEFNFYAYQLFYDTQIAWMNFDYDKLKELLTDELYNSYVMQLDTLKIKNHKNTMKEFELINSHIFDLKEENDIYIAKVYLNVKFYDYIENVNTGMILRGTTNRKLNNIYVLTLIKSKELTKNMNICPSCGANVAGNSTGICEYCKSKLINKNYDWIISKKEKISQK